MNRADYDHDQENASIGIHGQVFQAASLQHIRFEMPPGEADGATTAVGIFMENGSGSFLSDLTCYDGNIGFWAGSHQHAALNLQFTSCLTSILMIWNWGFARENIYVYSCWMAIYCTSIGGIDSQFNGVPCRIP
ncbi:glucan 1,3-beta-glucosidase [Colletotrichum sojae]|uniref:Glucan 1,3-beta-glucosidase n=1 Tax=Colletotrichum sojae TaxID=2175907 RepID=A0A8H6MMG5_9PEZI|nr:glucan 1,3-beta-glucosidase [Colletotrichum sojae]